ncbi:hypothetical protein B0H67DRAFT_233848 [Lasiosphaeris hirsuta]|uniref:Uncharacterized protein n=1 Tax=Lasiosphaeris hirsuta TaxID=260670 RepID=A0AA40DVK3_9PEZI|nr:hypothetical protein B0H67DRAFT_233848 [Lasiosphaeris hirsuta]
MSLNEDVDMDEYYQNQDVEMEAPESLQLAPQPLNDCAFRTIARLRNETVESYAAGLGVQPTLAAPAQVAVMVGQIHGVLVGGVTEANLESTIHSTMSIMNTSKVGVAYHDPNNYGHVIVAERVRHRANPKDRSEQEYLGDHKKGSLIQYSDYQPPNDAVTADNERISHKGKDASHQVAAGSVSVLAVPPAPGDRGARFGHAPR